MAVPCDAQLFQYIVRIKVYTFGSDNILPLFFQDVFVYRFKVVFV